MPGMQGMGGPPPAPISNEALLERQALVDDRALRLYCLDMILAGLKELNHDDGPKVIEMSRLFSEFVSGEDEGKGEE